MKKDNVPCIRSSSSFFPEIVNYKKPVAYTSDSCPGVREEWATIRIQAEHSKAVSFVFSTLFFLIIIIPKKKLIRRMRSRAEKCSYYNDQWREGLHETQQWAFMAEKLRTRPALLSSTPRHCTVKPTKLFSICTLFFPCFILSILSPVNYELVNSQN